MVNNKKKYIKDISIANRDDTYGLISSHDGINKDVWSKEITKLKEVNVKTLEEAVELLVDLVLARIKTQNRVDDKAFKDIRNLLKFTIETDEEITETLKRELNM